jgi:hypothetical protein
MPALVAGIFVRRAFEAAVTTVNLWRCLHQFVRTAPARRGLDVEGCEWIEARHLP